MRLLALAALSSIALGACALGGDDARETGKSSGDPERGAPLEWPVISPDKAPRLPGSAARGAALFQRGEELSEGGEALSGQPIIAVVGAGDVPVSAASLPCAGCHGKDGRGRSEGGVSPPPVRWGALSRPYEVTAALGRRRGPYTAALLVRAVTMGVDASGNRLDPVMPRYRLTSRDAADLAAYLQSLDSATEPGLTAAEVHIGGLFSHDAEGDAARAAVTALLEDISARQGIFGRRLVLDAPPDLAAPSAAAGSVGVSSAAVKEPFAWVGVVESGEPAGPASDWLARAVADGVPAVISTTDDIAPPAGEGLFMLHGGMAEEAESLLALSAARAPKGGRALVLRGPGDAAEKAARRVKEGCSRAGLSRCEASPKGELPSGEALSEAGTTSVFVLGWTGESAPLWEAIAKIPGAPLVLIAGGLGAFDAPRARRGLNACAPRSLRGRLFVSAWPPEQDPSKAFEYDSFAAAHGLSREHISAQRRALSAASLLVEGLRRAGRDATREGLSRAIEGIRDHASWIGPPLSFGRSRHIGAAPPVFSMESGGRLSPVDDPAQLL